MTIDRDNYNRVTNILTPFTGIEFVPKELLDFAGDRGTRVHKHIEGILSGWEFKDEGALIKPYVTSFRKFWQNSKHAFAGGKLILEQRLYCDIHKITGQPDVIIEMGDQMYILDWKTSSSFHKSWYLQGAAYRYMCAQTYGMKSVDNVFFVKLNKDKPATLYKSEDYEENLDTFFKCVELFRWFEMDKTRKKWDK